MARIVVLLVFVICCFSVIEANEKKTRPEKAPGARKHALPGADACEPGRISQGSGCSRCYCDSDRNKICGAPAACMLSSKPPSDEELIHLFSKGDLSSLPVLANQGEECTPGEAYRVDCNRCVCLETRSTLCQNRLCASFADVNRIKAKQMSGKPCEDNDVLESDCVQCSCSNSTYLCEAKDDCIPAKLVQQKLPSQPGKKHKIPGLTPNRPIRPPTTRIRPTRPRKIPQSKGQQVLKGSQDTETASGACVPGKFYPGPGCSRCYCNGNGKKICGTRGTCMLNDKPPSKDEVIHTFSTADLNTLPVLTSQGAECKPGEAYRIDCNRCLCLETRSVLCETLLCPSYDDVNRIKAKEMSGNPCEDDAVIDNNCVQCSCTEGKYACEAKPDCVPSRSLQLKLPLKFGDGTERHRYCRPGKRYRHKINGTRCKCSYDGKLQCHEPKRKHPKVPKQPMNEEETGFSKPDIEKKCTPGIIYIVKGKQRKCLNNGKLQTDGPETPKLPVIDEEWLKPNSKTKCTPGVMYTDRDDCNLCSCDVHKVLTCTLMYCKPYSGEN